MPPGFGPLHPGGMPGNSPTFQRWVREFRGAQVPKGRLMDRAGFQPSLRDLSCCGRWFPTLKRWAIIACPSGTRTWPGFAGILWDQILVALVLNDGWSRFRLGELFAGIGSARQRGLLQTTIYSRRLFPCAKLSLAQKAQGTWLAQACGLAAQESFNEDDIYSAMDQLTGHWAGLEKQLYQRAFPQAVRLVLYDLTSVYFEGKGPEHLARYGHSRDHRSDRPQIILAVATDTEGQML